MATKLGAEVAEKWTGRIIPLVSAGAAGALNYYFVRSWGRRAQAHFHARHLAVRKRSLAEPRYLALVESAISGSRLIGMIQPTENEEKTLKPALSQIGCAGRITSYRETEDGRYLITLTGICRFRVAEELDTPASFRETDLGTLHALMRRYSFATLVTQREGVPPSTSMP